MKKDRTNNWKSIYNTFIETAAEALPRILPSGRLKGDEKMDYQSVIEKASRNMIRFKRPERLIRMIVRVIAEQVRASHTGVLLYREKQNAYVLIDSKGEAGKRIPVGYIRIPYDNAIISVFKEENSPFFDDHGALTSDTLIKLVKDKDAIAKNSALKDKADKVRKEMELLRADICIPAYFKRRLLGILILGGKLSGQKFSDDEIGFFSTLAADAAMAITNAQLIEDLQGKIREIATLYEREHRLFMHTSVALSAAIDARDPYTHGHTERVTQYSLILADELKNDPRVSSRKNFMETVHIASLLHDIGKIGIPDNILNKKNKLTDEEFKKIRQHPEIGETILRPIKELGEITDIVKCHQERYDGTGYPKGLKGEEVPFIARIIAVADTFDAMTTNRPYRGKKHIQEAVKEIENNSGTQFDPAVVEAFVSACKKGKFPVKTSPAY